MFLDRLVVKCMAICAVVLLAAVSGCSNREAPRPATGPDGLTRLDPARPKDSWLIEVRKVIYQIWRENAPRGLPGRVVAGVTVGSDGRLLEVEILESSGVVALDEYAVEAIRSAAPFPPFPSSMGDSVTSFRTRFDYIEEFRS